MISFRRKMDPVIVDNITPHLEARRLFPLDDIVATASVEDEFDGNDAIDPMIMAQVTNFGGKKRATDDEEVSHPINVMMRYHVWKLGVINSPQVMRIESTHDLGEALSMGSFSGAMAIGRWIGLCNGKEYEVASHFMTDFYSLMVEVARKKGTRTQQHEKSKTIEQITLDDVISDLIDLKAQLVGVPKKDSEKEQRRSLNALKTRINGAQKDLHNHDLIQRDMERYEFNIKKYVDNVQVARRNLISAETVQQVSSLYFDTMIEKLRSLKMKEEMLAPFDKGRSVAYHLVREAAYGLYIDELCGFAKGSERSRKIASLLGETRDVSQWEFDGMDLLLAKVSDRKDNIRKPKGYSPVQVAWDYKKTVMTSEGVETYLRSAQQLKGQKGFGNLARAVDALKHELILTVVSNYGIFNLKADTQYEKSMEVVKGQFIDMYERFKEPFMKEFRKLLDDSPWKVAIERNKAVENGRLYNHLDKMYKSQIAQEKGQSRQGSSSFPWWSIPSIMNKLLF